MAKRENKPASDQMAETCDGQTLKNLARAGLAWLEHNHEKVNALNVFPVPDGDTGTNMLLTMRSAWKEIAASDERHLGRVAHIIYNGALMGARGNSGVILSQLWRGFARGVEQDTVLTSDALVRGLLEATHIAYQAVQEPVEGTILTVAREASEEAAEAVRATGDMREILRRAVQRSEVSIARTPDLLPVLKEAGVVDAGGLGFKFVLEGMLRLLDGQPVELAEGEIAMAGPQGGSIDLSGLDFPYDVQFLLMGENLDIDNIRQTITDMGDSALIVGDPSVVKVHVHVVNPGVPISYAAQLGKLTDVVVENMALQYEAFVGEGGPRMPEENAVQPPQIADGAIAAVTVAPGDGLTRIFYSAGAARVVSGGQTMNPSTEEIVTAINSLPTDKVVILPNNKNILLAAEQAAKLVADKQTRVVPTTTIPQGIAALLALDPHGDLSEVADAMASAGKMVETGEVTRATRNVTLDGVKVKQGQMIGLHNDILRIAGDDLIDVVVRLLGEMGASDLELITVYFGADVSPDSAKALIDHLSGVYPDQEFELHSGGQAHYFYIISAE